MLEDCARGFFCFVREAERGVSGGAAREFVWSRVEFSLAASSSKTAMDRTCFFTKTTQNKGKMHDYSPCDLFFLLIGAAKFLRPLPHFTGEIGTSGEI